MTGDALVQRLVSCHDSDIRHYIFYCIDRLSASGLVLQIFPLAADHPVRVGQILYYLAPCLCGSATQAQGTVKALLTRLQTAGHLEFDPETWEGGQNDAQWFARLTARRGMSEALWIEDYLRLRGILPRQAVEEMLEDRVDCSIDIRRLRKRGVVHVIAEMKRPRRGQSLRSLLDETVVAHEFQAIGDRWTKIDRATAADIAVDFLRYDQANGKSYISGAVARHLAQGFMWPFTRISRWYTNVAVGGGPAAPVTKSGFGGAIACIDPGIVAVLSVTDEAQ